MKKVLTAFLVSVLVLLLAFGGGYYTGWYFHQARPVVIEKEKLVYEDRIRDYSRLSWLQLQEELIKYDRGIPTRDVKSLHIGKRIARTRADAGLNDRIWSREVTITVARSGNWKLYVGLSVGAVAGIGLTYGLVKLLK